MELTRRSTVATTQRQKTKTGFTPFYKSLGIYCNGFWGCGDLDPHKCNLNDLSHPIKEVEIVEEKRPINRCMLSLLSYISYRQVYRSRERERSRYFVRRGSKEKKERELRRVCSRNFVTSFVEDNKDKVPMDVATSLVVNHVNIGVLCLFELYL